MFFLSSTFICLEKKNKCPKLQTLDKREEKWTQ